MNTAAAAGWQRALRILVGSLAVALLLQWSTMVHLVSVWRIGDDYRHAWLVLPLLLYLAAGPQRERLLAHTPQAGWHGLWLVLPAVLLWLVGARLDVMALQHLALVLSLFACCLFALGPSTCVGLAPLLGLLLFLFPAGDLLLPLLEPLTRFWLQAYAALTGYTIEVEGYRIVFEGLPYRIEPECAGLQTFNMFLFLGYAFGLLLFRRPASVVMLAGAFAAVAVFGNALRVCAIVTLDVLRGTQMTLTAHRDVQLIIVSVLLVAMLLLVSRLRPAGAPPVEAQAAG